MKSKLLYVILIAGVLALAGCVRTITTAPYSKTRNHGVIYSLPRTLLKVTVTYTVREAVQQTNGIPTSSAREILIAKPVTLEPILAMDNENRFILSGEGLVKSSHLDASFKFQLADQPLLTSVSAEATDKSPEIFQGLVSSGISIAKIFAPAGEDLDKLPTPLKEIARRLIAINAKMAELASSTDSKKLEQFEALVKEREMLITAATKFIEANTAKIKDTDATYTWVLDLKDFKTDSTGSWVEKELFAPEKKFGDFSVAEVPIVRVAVQLSAEQFANATKAFFCCENCKEESGVVYRSPELVRVHVTNQKASTLVFDDNVLFANVGPFNLVDVKTKIWAKRKTQVTFSPTTGSIKEYGVEATSSAEAAAKALDTSLGKIQSAAADMKKAQDAAEAAKKTPEQIKISELDTQKKLLEAEAALIKAQQELDKLKSGSGSK